MLLTCSIIVPTHNKKDALAECLAAIHDQVKDRLDVEIIVIDDGSSDQTAEVVENISGMLPVQYRRLTGLGPARARNEGIARARGAIVVMVDDDVVPQPGWLKALLSPFQHSPSVMGVEGKVLPSGTDFGLLGMSPRNLTGGVFLTCNIAFRRDVLLKVGGFDESFRYPAFEDTDLALQVQRFGRIAWAPEAVVHHPRRCWSLARALHEIRFNEPLTRFTLRYGCLGWKDRATDWPRIRVAYSAILALPVGRIVRAMREFRESPWSASRFLIIAATQGLAATVVVWKYILSGARDYNDRRSSLSTYARENKAVQASI